MIFSLSWKNVWRNRLRSAVIITSIALGLLGGVFSTAFMNGMGRQTIQAAVSTELAHIQIHEPSYVEEPLTSRVIPKADSVVSVLKSQSIIKTFAERTRITAMVSSAKTGSGVNVKGVDPAQEKEIIRLLLHYSDQILYTYQEDKYDEPRHITVAEYIIGEILNDDLEFKNLIYKQIFQEYLDALNAGEKLDNKHFIYHSDPGISKLAADLLSTSYTLSKIFKKGGVHIETEDMKLKKIVPETIIAYKRKILEIAQSDSKARLKEAQEKKASGEEMDTLQKEFMQITTVINAISKDRGWVAFK